MDAVITNQKEKTPFFPFILVAMVAFMAFAGISAETGGFATEQASVSQALNDAGIGKKLEAAGIVRLQHGFKNIASTRTLSWKGVYADGHVVSAYKERTNYTPNPWIIKVENGVAEFYGNEPNINKQAFINDVIYFMARVTEQNTEEKAVRDSWKN